MLYFLGVIAARTAQVASTWGYKYGFSSTLNSLPYQTSEYDEVSPCALAIHCDQLCTKCHHRISSERGSAHPRKQHYRSGSTSSQFFDTLHTAVSSCSTQDTLTGSEEVAVVVGFQSCSPTGCLNPADYMGQILYNGPFNPQFHEPTNPPYENFTVQVPTSATPGSALLEVVHVTLIGVSPWYPCLLVICR